MDINELNQKNPSQFGILAQISNKTAQLLKQLPPRQAKRVSERKLRLRWILAISCIPLFGIYTAFGIAPQTITSNINRVDVIEELTLPEINSTETSSTESAQTFWYKDHVRRDDSLQSVLLRLNIRNNEAIDFIRNDPIASQIASSLIPGKQVEAETDDHGTLITLEYAISTEQLIKITKTDGHYQADKMTQQLEVRPILKSAQIESSLFGATDAADIPDSIAIQVADMFESEIDFHTDLRRGDRFNVIYEGSYSQDGLVKTGDVLAAEFTNKGKTFRAIGFRDENQQMQYFTPDGKSLHKSFLRSPLEFSRVSSGFSAARFHPVLQRMRAHKGTDFAAPTGTKIKASGDAVVDFVGQKGGYGNVIVLKHSNGIKTVYGHLSRFASGLNRGDKITQGEVIGYVGMSGVATGPHLHYEFLLNGQHRDPMTVALPKANPIAVANRAQFNQISLQLSAQLRLLESSNIAALD